MDKQTEYKPNEQIRLTMARTLYGEARGEGRHGMECVAQVILNRVNRGGWWGNDIASVCLKPWQFSCWNYNDPNRSKIEKLMPGDNDVFNLAYEIAGEAMAGTMPNHIGYDVYHYKVRGLYANWAVGHVASYTAGGHEFYKGLA
nr:cell wall hydrolase [Terasakiella sp. SH-1]